MNLPPDLPAAWQWVAHVALAVILVWTAWRAPWQRLASNEGSNVYLGALVALALLWTIAGHLGPAVHFHLLGASILYLMFGLPLAIIGMTAVTAISVAAGAVAWESLSLTAIASGIVPASVSYLMLRFAEKRLPPNYFVYIFVVAFFGSAAAMLAAGASSALLISTGVPHSPSPGDDWLAMLLLLAFGEATLSGMVMALFVVYRPSWVATFDDERYLGRRERP